MALPQLFSIGEMAKIFHLSVSSLRHYEALGLVTPEYSSTLSTGSPLLQRPPVRAAQHHPVSARAGHAAHRDRRFSAKPRRGDDRRKAARAEGRRRTEAKGAQAHRAQARRARLSQLHEVRHAPLGEIALIHSPALRLFWIDTALTAPDYSALELSTSRRIAAAQAEALVFLGKVGFSVSQEHLNEGSFGQYDGEFRAYVGRPLYGRRH